MKKCLNKHWVNKRHAYVAENISESTLRLLASEPLDGSDKRDNSYFMAPGFAQLAGMADVVAQKICSVIEGTANRKYCEYTMQLCTLVA